MKKLLVIGILFLLMAIALILKWGWMLTTKQEEPPAAQLPNVGFNVNLLAVDYAHLKTPYIQQSIRKGKLYFLLTIKKTKKEVVIDLLDSFKSLKRFDTNQDNAINLSDSGYYQLYLGRFDQASRTIFYHSLDHSGVGSIQLIINDKKTPSAKALLRIDDTLPVVEVRIQVTSPKRITVEEAKDIPLKNPIFESGNTKLKSNL